MREAEGVAEFVADAADEDGIVLAEGDAAVFAIADDGFFEREVFGVELGGSPAARRCRFGDYRRRSKESCGQR